MLFCSYLISDSNVLELILKCKDSKAGGGVLSGSLAPIIQIIYFTQGKNGKKFGQLQINLNATKIQEDHMKVTYQKWEEKQKSHTHTHTKTHTE